MSNHKLLTEQARELLVPLSLWTTLTSLLLIVTFSESHRSTIGSETRSFINYGVIAVYVAFVALISKILHNKLTGNSYIAKNKAINTLWNIWWVLCSCWFLTYFAIYLRVFFGIAQSSYSNFIVSSVEMASVVLIFRMSHFITDSAISNERLLFRYIIPLIAALLVIAGLFVSPSYLSIHKIIILGKAAFSALAFFVLGLRIITLKVQMAYVFGFITVCLSLSELFIGADLFKTLVRGDPSWSKVLSVIISLRSAVFLFVLASLAKQTHELVEADFPKHSNSVKSTMLHRIVGTDAKERIADIIFVHGLNPLGILNRDHAFETWGGTDISSDFWPRWLGEDLREMGLPIGIWLLEYDAAALGWLGHGMPLTDRASSVLDTFYGEGIGDRPILFVAHSLGGLVVKQLLNRSATIGKETETSIAEMAKAVIFLATPHTGADIASFATSLGGLLRQTDALKELVANSAPLREQSDWYLNQSPKLGIKTRSYFETRKTGPVGLIVDQTSANPHIAGASVVAVDADHSGISRIATRELSQYKSLRRFIEETLRGFTVSTDASPKGSSYNESPNAQTLEKDLAPLEQRMMRGLARPEVSVLWYLVLGTRMDDDIPGRSRDEAVTELLARSRDRAKIPELIAEMARAYPHVMEKPADPR